MANRNFHRDSAALERGVVTLYAPISIGAAGVATLGKKLGVAAITRTGAGVYEVELDDKYNKLLHVNAVIFGADQDFTYQITSRSVATDKRFTLITKVAGVAADLADTTELSLEIILKNSSVEL